MPRYIDVERIPNDSFWEGMTPKEKAKVLQWFLQTPTADVEEVKYSEWLTEHARRRMLSGAVVEWDRQICSNCKHHQIQTSNYCPNCGAKMCTDDMGDVDVNEVNE